MEARIERLAVARERSKEGLVREAIGQYVEREERRESLRRDTFAAWNDYRTTGLHLTGEEADIWLAGLEAGEDAEMPECHD